MDDGGELLKMHHHHHHYPNVSSNHQYVDDTGIVHTNFYKPENSN